MTQPDPRALHRAAREAVARGWHVFPLRPGDKRPAGHSEARCPRTGRCTHGHLKPEQRATTDPDLIHQCWRGHPYGVGIATGPSGLLVVDLDVPKAGKDKKDAPDGATTFAALCERAGQPWPTTYTVRTPSGGQHLYFSAPAGAKLPSSAGTLAERIDTRGWGGYVIAAGNTINGQRYEATDERAAVAALPAWLWRTLQPPALRAPSAIAPARNATRRAQVALERERAAIEAAVEGEREHTLFAAARKLGRFVAWGDISRHEVEEAFQRGGEAAGLKPYECRSTLRSALNWSIANCRPKESV